MRLFILLFIFFLAGCSIPISKNDIFVTGEKYNPANWAATKFQPQYREIASESGFLATLVFNPEIRENTIIIARGSSGNITTPFWLDLASLLASLNARVILFDYSGYGRSTGSASIEQLSTDLENILDYFLQNKRANDIAILYGVSIGTVPAIKSSVRRSDIDGVVLEAPISSAKSFISARKNTMLGGVFFEVDLEDGIDFNSVENIKNIDKPVLILHGKKDSSVPIELGRELFEAIPIKEKTFVEFPQGLHAGLYKVDQEKFLSSVRDFLLSLK